MAQQQTNSNNSSMSSRMKKYDSYNPRPGSLHRSPHPVAATNHNPIQVQDFAAPKPLNQQQRAQHLPVKSTAYSAQNNYHKLHLSKSNHVPPKLHPTAERPKVAARQTGKSDVIALKAVKDASTAENTLYADQFSTVYASGRRKLSRLQKFMYGVGVAVFIFSMAVSVQSFMTNKQAKEQIATLGENTSKDEQGVVEGTGDEPSEVPIPESAVHAYRPANPEDPKVLRIPEINVFARIKSLGVTPGGAVDTPKNIFDTGWYNGGARPGNTVGSSLILGHVSGWTGPGVFKNINKLHAGSRFEIEKGTGEKVYYEVTRTEQIPANQVDMSKILATEVAGQHDIKLMTCSGRYNSETKSFDDRFVVYGKQIK